MGETRVGEMRSSELIEYLDAYLRIGEVPDYPNALNGLQVEGGEEVERIGAAVDASEASIREAVRRGCDLLLVHHGLFWDGNRPVTGRRYRRLRPLLERGIAVYSAHLPLDVHPEVGNNVVLARELGIELEGEFGEYRGVPVGVWGRLDLSREALLARLDEVLGARVHLLPGGPERVARVGVLTGSGGGMIGAAIDAGLDALVTGEGAHHTYFDAVEGGINVYYGGHYATETWGVRALAAHLSNRFGVASEFIDLPTGL
ncbi:MAG TPA: Nif3-like dinuclear metal center hexameric protein [Longimicrobiales bacterium]